VTQNATDNASLAPLVEQVEQRCGAPSGAALADSGFFSIDNIQQVERRNIDAYVLDSNMARALNLGARCRTRTCHPAHRRMRAKLRTPAGQAAYARRKAIVEPDFGVLKQQRGMRQVRTRGLRNANNEFTLATLAHNITRLHAERQAETTATGGQNRTPFNEVLTQALKPEIIFAPISARRKPGPCYETPLLRDFVTGCALRGPPFGSERARGVRFLLRRRRVAMHRRDAFSRLHGRAEFRQ
jgi:hypothetical protein